MISSRRFEQDLDIIKQKRFKIWIKIAQINLTHEYLRIGDENDFKEEGNKEKNFPDLE